MKKGQKTRKRSKKLRKEQATAKVSAISDGDLARLEFHRHALALMPEPGEKRPGIAYFIKGDAYHANWRFCSCTASKRQTCGHILKLSQIFKFIQANRKGRSLSEDFRSSIWHRLARILGEASRPTFQSIRIEGVRHGSGGQPNAKGSADGYGNGKSIRISDPDDNELLLYLSQGPDASRLVERLAPIPDEDTVPSRSAVLEKLLLATLTENERMMLDRGFKTRGLALEESLWYRIGYHAYKEFGPTDCTFHPAIEENSGAFTITCRKNGGEPLFRMSIPRDRVRSVLAAFRELLPNQHDLAIHPIPLKSIFKVTMNTDMDLDVRPMIQLIQENGEQKFFERDDLERFRYGDLVYVKELGIMAELEQPGEVRKFRPPVKMVLKKSQVPSFLEEFEHELQEGSHIVDEKVKSLRIFKGFDRVEISIEAIDRDWCWLDVKYGVGSTFISLREILSAKKEGHRFVGITEGWIDCQSRELDTIAEAFSETGFDSTSERMKLSLMDLLRLKATCPKPLEFTGDEERVRLLNQILELKPSTELPPLKGMNSALRSYQKLGAEWLLFLFENGLGGLLCDDMGLGKTHQALAFMLALKEQGKSDNPFLVICPTTVLSHWKNKIRQHFPAIQAYEYYGTDRNIEEVGNGADIVLTSYGVLRRDIQRLKEQPFSVVVLDEIQHIKNSETLSHKAATGLQAHIKLGMTGTPIENALMELKALMDVTVPGYLGSDARFLDRYVKAGQSDFDNGRREELSKLISPFTLRRLKSTVLHELPDKIEDILNCRLSDDQVKLYRDAISSRGRGLVDKLRSSSEPVPYMHIFALLTLLKRICDHPSLVTGDVEDYEKYQSGKWELFKELLTESLDSGQKVVVYSQYLGMVKIIGKFLEKQDIVFATLTGASRNRGEIISRFNNDPNCRIYVGSLKAGGSGIDLIAASVVIHYDRWWNAAKEDQATDRVHRIGQRRGVQVFKLVTEGTMEEKVSAIIEKKKHLMDSVVKEDDPGLLKTFSREELMEMLSDPDTDETLP